MARFKLSVGRDVPLLKTRLKTKDVSVHVLINVALKICGLASLGA